MLICKQCEKPYILEPQFQKSLHRKSFCSFPCLVKSGSLKNSPIKEKICNKCGIVFHPNNRRQIYCGNPKSVGTCSYKNYKMLCKKFNVKNRDSGRAKLWNREYRNKRRKQVIEAYGGKCACCGEKEIKFLAYDHVNNDGKDHRKVISAQLLTGWIIRNNYPKNIQILCHNCNLAKGFYGKCPHIM